MKVKSIYWNLGQEKPKNFFRYIDTSAINNNKNVINYDNLEFLDPNKAPSRARKLVSEQSVLFSTVRPYLKNIAIVTNTTDYLIASTAFIVLDTLMYAPYLKYYLLSDSFIRRVNERSTGTSYPAINDASFNSLLVAIPPLAEQKRIVDQIERALEKVDEYAEIYNKLQELDKTFPDKLKKSILQYAMQGKLVAQDPNDEPVEVLLEKIKAEKQKLFEEGKLKKKDLEEMVVVTGDDNSPYQDVPYTIPESWEWVKVRNISQINSKNINYSGKASFIPMSLIDDGYSNRHTFEIKAWDRIKKGYTHFQEGDILLAKITPCFQNRKSAIATNLIGKIGSGTTEIYSIRVNRYIEPLFLLYIFKSSDFISNGMKNFTGTAGQQRVPRTFVENYPIPLPPLAEQERIVSKISQIFSVVEILV
ncbi:restriction endonuclease subunit S [Aerococcaceae bacterium zg-ZJ1578]|nr:restriction endonuclease subunit S [Aerococcaceae bacterium zg-1578]